MGTTKSFLSKKGYNKVAKKRLVLFQSAAEKIKLKYRRSLFNRTSLVLFENKVKNKDEYFGRDEYSNSVIVKTKENLKGKIKEVKITNGNQNTLFGEITQRFNKRNFAA